MRTRSLPSVAIVLMTFAAGAHGQTAYTPWSEPVNLGAIVNSSVSEFFSCVSKDGLACSLPPRAISIDRASAALTFT